MPPDFDSLNRRVGDTAARLKAFGYLNTVRPDDPGRETGYEVRFQPNPIHALWNERRFGVSQRFPSATEVASFLDVVERAAAGEQAGIAANDPGALDRVLGKAQEYRKHVQNGPAP